MKRKLSLFLALLMILSCMVPALAVGEFEAYGPMDDWSEEQWVVSEEWSDEQWDDYWTDYDAWWYEAYGAEEEAYWANYLRERKAELGMPYPDGINVCLNGEFLDCGDTAPAAVNGRTMVPFRALLEALDAQVDYVDGKITALFEDGTLMELQLDSTVIELTENGETRPVQMDVAPWIDPSANRILVPVRFVGDALGLDVDWDDYFEVAHLTDWAAAVAEIDSHFTILNKIMAASLAEDLKATSQIKSDFSIAGTLYGEKKHDTATFSVSGETLSNGMQLSGEYTTKVDLGGLKDTLITVLPEEALDIIDTLNKGRFSLIMDTEAGGLYLKGTTLSDLSDGMLPSGKWISFGDDVMPALSYQDLLGEEGAFTVGSLMVETQRSSYYYLCPLESLQEQVKVLRLLMDDSCFTTKTSGTTTTYTADMTLLKIFTRAAEMGLVDLDDLNSLFGQGSSLPTGSYKMVVTLKDDKISELAFSGSVKLSTPIPLEISFDLKSDQKTSTCTFDFKGAYIGKIEMRATDVATPSTKTVPTAPPAGEEVVDYETLMEAYYEKLYQQYGW